MSIDRVQSKISFLCLRLFKVSGCTGSWCFWVFLVFVGTSFRELDLEIKVIFVEYGTFFLLIYFSKGCVVLGWRWEPGLGQSQDWACSSEFPVQSSTSGVCQSKSNPWRPHLTPNRTQRVGCQCPGNRHHRTPCMGHSQVQSAVGASTSRTCSCMCLGCSLL